MEENNLKQMVKLLDQLKQAYVLEKSRGNTEKAEEIKVQMLKMVNEIKKIKEQSEITGETVNINTLRDDLQKDEKIDEVVSENPVLDYGELREEVKQEEVQTQKSVKQIKKELEQEKKKLKKIAKAKKKEESQTIKNIKKQEKIANSKIKRVSKTEKEQLRAEIKNDKKRRKDSQLKEVKVGTVILFSALILLLLVVTARGYIYFNGYIKVKPSGVDYIGMYNFFIKLAITIVIGITIVFSIIQSNLQYRLPLLITSIVSGILLLLSFDLLPDINNFRIMAFQGDTYLIIPGLLLCVVIHLVGLNIYRDKIHYDFDYS